MKQAVVIFSMALLFISCSKENIIRSDTHYQYLHTGKSSLTDKKIADLIGICGFTYDEEYDIYKSNVDSLQRRFGYTSLFDMSAVPVGMVIDCEPVKFNHNDKEYMIELWKGQYDLSTGAEIGIYKKSDKLVTWESGTDEDMLQMGFSLMKKGNVVFKRSDSHWWLTGFKPGEFSNLEELTMDVSITFKDTAMLASFVKGMQKIGYKDNDYKINSSTINFTFNRPKTKQWWSLGSCFVKYTQKKNELLVKTYNSVKENQNIKDNSPKSISGMLNKFPDLILYFIKYQHRTLNSN